MDLGAVELVVINLLIPAAETMAETTIDRTKTDRSTTDQTTNDRANQTTEETKIIRKSDPTAKNQPCHGVQEPLVKAPVQTSNAST